MDAPMTEEEVQNSVTYEELQFLEYDFEAAENEVLRQQYKLCKPLYERRSASISKIKHFWALVFEECPPDFDQYIMPTDSKIFAECLKDVQVTRPEVDDANGSPRTVHIKLTFSPNEYFENEALEKTFWYRRSKDNDNDSCWLVSEPVKIDWKKGKDPTHGLTDAAFDLWQRKKQQQQHQEPSDKTNGAPKKLPEEAVLIKKLEGAGEEFTSFFTLFSFVSENRYISTEESLEANKAHRQLCDDRKNGISKEQAPIQWPENDEQETEVCPNGADIATVLSEDIWPNAIKYFTSAQEQDDEDLSDLDGIEDLDGSDEDAPIDIRSLVTGKRRDPASSSSPPNTPPAKARKL